MIGYVTVRGSFVKRILILLYQPMITSARISALKHSNLLLLTEITLKQAKKAETIMHLLPPRFLSNLA